MATCDQCGGEVHNKNEAGHFRAYCCDCIIARAGSDPDDARPIPNCTCDACQAAA